MPTPEERAAIDNKAAEEAEQHRKDRGDELEAANDSDADPGAAANDELSPEDLAAVAAEDHVPRARLRESERQLREEREARIRLDAENRLLREQGAPAKAADPEVDVKALRKAAANALMEGDTDKHAEIMEQIDAAKDKQTDAKIEARAERIVAERDLRKAANAVAREYPFLDPNSPDFNQDANDETLALRNVYIGKGYSWDEALRKAADKTARDYGGKGGNESDELARRRDAVALSRGAAAARHQPQAPVGGKGLRATGGTPVDVEKMSDADFAKIPEAERKRLRGD